MNFNTLDILQGIFWSITYILAFVYGYKYRRQGIPLEAIILNFAWEANALIISMNAIHIAWFGIDTTIVAVAIARGNISRRKWNRFFLLAAAAFGVFFLLFRISTRYGMLYSSFIIDLFMAMCFLLEGMGGEREISMDMVIGMAKLVGDYFAWRAYSYDQLVLTLGAMIQIINIMYLLFVWNNWYRRKKQSTSSVKRVVKSFLTLISSSL